MRPSLTACATARSRLRWAAATFPTLSARATHYVSWRHAQDTSHAPRHVALVCEARFQRHLTGGKFALHEQRLGTLHPALDDVLVHRESG
jgi:hypothetical protein